MLNKKFVKYEIPAFPKMRNLRVRTNSFEFRTRVLDLELYAFADNAANKINSYYVKVYVTCNDEPKKAARYR